MNRAFPITPSPPEGSQSPELVAVLQAFGVQWIEDPNVLVPILTHVATRAPYSVEVLAGGTTAALLRDGRFVAQVTFPAIPKTRGRGTAEAIPYWKSARADSSEVLGTM